MKTKTKAVVTVICVLALIATAVFGSLAYLTDQDQATNTFTMGKVDITLDEAKVDENGSALEDEPRVHANDYNSIVPGVTYDKDPTVHVIAGPCYIRVLVKINKVDKFNEILRAHNMSAVDLMQIFTGFDTTLWNCHYNPFVGGTPSVTVTNLADDEAFYEFWYIGGTDNAAVTGDDLPLFTGIKVPEWLENADMAMLEGDPNANPPVPPFTIDIIAHAIQTGSFTGAPDAWTHWASFEWPTP